LANSVLVDYSIATRRSILFRIVLLKHGAIGGLFGYS